MQEYPLNLIEQEGKKMKISIICLLLFSAALITYGDSQATTPAATDPTVQTTNQTTPVISNLTQTMQGPIDLNNQQTMDALTNDPMLKGNPMLTNDNNAGTLSGSADAKIINADGAFWNDINQQVNNDIDSSSNFIASGNNPDSAAASAISNELHYQEVQ